MKRFVAGVMVGFAASCAVAFGSPNAKHNGTFWNKLTQAAKHGYVSGYADGMQVSVSKLDTLTTAGDLLRWRGSRRILSEVESQLSMSNLAREDAVNHLDTLYDNQKYTELDLGSALQLMALRLPAISANASSSH